MRKLKRKEVKIGRHPSRKLITYIVHYPGMPEFGNVMASFRTAEGLIGDGCYPGVQEFFESLSIGPETKLTNMRVFRPNGYSGISRKNAGSYILDEIVADSRIRGMDGLYCYTETTSMTNFLLKQGFTRNELHFYKSL